ncbi:MAG TPA: orotate phosphoribosyltransferase [Acidimicrobiia bacterium]|nr:orotate phosphoribosyltransferase [Acidimicrobiia bacterium]
MSSDLTLDALITHLQNHALRTDGPFRLRSGAVSDWYLDARQTTYSGEGARLVGEAVLAALDDTVTAVGGMTMGADPIAMATAIAGAGHGRSLRAFSIRKEAKDHGIGGRLVGPVTTEDRVAVVEDTATTGGALFEAVDALEAAGIPIVQILVLVDRSDGKVADLASTRKIHFVPLLDPSRLGVS